jgi:hypothetical protein
MIILNEEHLRRVLSEYLRYCHDDRCRKTYAIHL